MIKKEITYRDLTTNKEVTETFYFNLTKFEAAELNLAENLEGIMKSTNMRDVVPLFSAVARKSVGTNAGGKFVKPVSYGDWFVASDAYSELFSQILGADDAEDRFALFLKGVIPPEFVSQVETRTEEVRAESPSVSTSDLLSNLDMPREEAPIEDLPSADFGNSL